MAYGKSLIINVKVIWFYLPTLGVTHLLEFYNPIKCKQEISRVTKGKEGNNIKTKNNNFKSNNNKLFNSTFY